MPPVDIAPMMNHPAWGKTLSPAQRKQALELWQAPDTSDSDRIEMLKVMDQWQSAPAAQAPAPTQQAPAATAGKRTSLARRRPFRHRQAPPQKKRPPSSGVFSTWRVSRPCPWRNGRRRFRVFTACSRSSKKSFSAVRNRLPTWSSTSRSPRHRHLPALRPRRPALRPNGRRRCVPSWRHGNSRRVGRGARAIRACRVRSA